MHSDFELQQLLCVHVKTNTVRWGFGAAGATEATEARRSKFEKAVCMLATQIFHQKDTFHFERVLENTSHVNTKVSR